MASFRPLKDDIILQVDSACQGAMPAGQGIVSPPGIVLNKNFTNYAQRILDLEVRDDDVWLVSYPKCGESPNLN